MTTVRATCSDCGDVKLASKKLTVRVCTDDDSATFRFKCPKCHKVEVRPARENQVTVLIASGAKLEEWAIPADLRETHSGEVISGDEVLDFSTELQDRSADAIFEELNAY